jgi:hypothetical protein
MLSNGTLRDGWNMMDVNTDTVRRLVALIREIHGQNAAPIAEDAGGAAVDWAGQESPEPAPDFSVAEFRSIVEDLEPDQQQQVVALMWLGRGDFEPEEWDEATSLAEERWSEDTASYLLSHPMLSEDLEAGLAALGFDDVA